VPANQKVSVGWQIVFTFLPVVNFWAFYRIRKLTKYFFYVVLPSIVFAMAIIIFQLALLVNSPGFIGSLDWQEGGYTMSKASEPTDIRVTVITNAIGWALQGFSVYLVIIWSRQYNRQFDQPTAQAEQP